MHVPDEGGESLGTLQLGCDPFSHDDLGNDLSDSRHAPYGRNSAASSNIDHIMQATIARKAEHSLGPLPLVIGFTGHRDLREEDLPKLEELVEEILTDIKRRYRSTSLVLLSSLAEGADRLGARVALRLDISLVVPLPLAPSIYIQDFAGEDSRAEFEKLLGASSSSFLIPVADSSATGEIERQGPARDRGYKEAGEFVARHSHLLIALWDGVSSGLTGGTSALVSFNLQRNTNEGMSVRDMLNPSETDPVYHIVTPRRSNPEPPGAFEVRLIVPDRNHNAKDTVEAMRYVHERTDLFNHDALRLASSLAKTRRQCRVELLGSSGPASLPDDIDRTLDLFATADAMSQYYSKRTHRVLAVLFLVVAAAAIAFDLYTHLFQTAWIMLAFYLMALILTYSLVLHSRRKSYQIRYLDYRALAEGLRVRIFWRIASIDESIADSYLNRQRSELDWVRYALRVWDIPRGHDSDSAAAVDANQWGDSLGVVLQRWVEDQRFYFISALKQEERSLTMSERWEVGLLMLGIVSATIQVLLQSFGGRQEPIHSLLVIIALAPIIAGLIIGYAEKRAFSDHARQYERMSILFSNAGTHLHRLLDDGNNAVARELIVELGKEALLENGDWVLLHRERPIEVPKA